MIWKENKRMLGHIYFVEGVQDYAAINFIQNHPPPGQTPRTRFEGGKNPLHGTIICVQKPSPRTKSI